MTANDQYGPDSHAIVLDNLDGTFGFWGSFLTTDLKEACKIALRNAIGPIDIDDSDEPGRIAMRALLTTTQGARMLTWLANGVEPAGDPPPRHQPN